MAPRGMEDETPSPIGRIGRCSLARPIGRKERRTAGPLRRRGGRRLILLPLLVCMWLVGERHACFPEDGGWTWWPRGDGSLRCGDIRSGADASACGGLAHLADHVKEPCFAAARAAIPEVEARACDVIGAEARGHILGEPVTWVLVARVGEARNPGPFGDDWSVPIYSLDQDGNIVAKLVPPEMKEIERAEARHCEVWDDHELRAFFDSIAPLPEASGAPVTSEGCETAQELADGYAPAYGLDGMEVEEDDDAMHGLGVGAPFEYPPCDPTVTPLTPTPVDDAQDAPPLRGSAEEPCHTPFFGCSAFTGRCPGFVFKLGDMGLGYYADDWVQLGPRRLSLERLIDYPQGGAATTDVPSQAHAYGMDAGDGGHYSGDSSGGDESDVDALAAMDGAVNGRRRQFGTPWRRPRVRQGRKGRRATREPCPHDGDCCNPYSGDNASPLSVQAGDVGHRAWGLWALDSANANAWHGALDYLKTSAADFCALQETRRAAGQAVAEAEDAAARHGWRLRMHHARRLPSLRLSAGVAVAARSHLGSAKAGIAAEVCPAYASRIIMSWMGAVMHGGFFFVSVYLHAKEGLSQRNLDLLQELARVLNALDAPWVCAGDWNCSPEQLRASNWPDLAGAVICAPGMATCGRRVLDFFAVSEGLAHAVRGVAVVLDSAFHPHSAVRLFLAAAPRSIRVRKLLRPRRLGPHLPAGCLSEVQQSAGEVSGRSFEGQPGVHLQGDSTSPPRGPPGHDNLDDAFARWVAAAESTLTNIAGMEQAEAAKYSGRADGPRTAWQCPMGMVGANTAHATPAARAWRCMAKWLRALESLHTSNGCTQAHTTTVYNAATAALRAMARSLRRPHGPCFEIDDGYRVMAGGVLAGEALQLSALRVYIDVAQAKADQLCRKAQREAISGWRTYMHGGPAHGLRRQHRFTRCPSGWTPSRVGPPPIQLPDDDLGGVRLVEGVSPADLRRAVVAETGVMRPLNAQELVEAEADDWGEQWAETGDDTPITWPADMGTALPTPSPTELRCAMLSFPLDTGLGWDNWHPRGWLRLGDGLLNALARLLVAAEGAGRWPAALGWVVVVLLAKAEGGFRPIGLFPSLIRLWMRVRRRQLRDWEADHQRAFLYAGAAKGANVAAWEQAAVAEAAASKGAAYAQLLLDMVKAFERVPRQQLVDEAARVGYPLHLLRLSLAAYKLPRVVMIGGVVSRRVSSTRGIAAGSGAATTELRALLLGLLDRLTAAFPAVRIQAYVDDITMDIMRTARLAASIMAKAGRALCEGLRALGLELSPTKCKCTASSARIGAHVSAALRQYGVQYCARVKSLGVGLGAGRRRNTSVLKKRFGAFLPRVKRFRRVRAARVAAAKLLHTGGTAAIDYGVAVTGVSDSDLMHRRRAVAAAMGEFADGRQLDLVFTMEAAAGRDVDPAVAAHVAPIGALAEAHWCKRLPARMLGSAAAAAVTRLTRAKRIWGAVAGPFAAAVASAARLGWVLTDGRKWTTDDGMMIDMASDPPAVVRRLVHAAVGRWRWRRADNALPGVDPRGEGVGAMMAPVKALLRAPERAERWTRATANALRSAAVGGQWTQSRLASAKLHDDARCQRCLVTPIWMIGGAVDANGSDDSAGVHKMPSLTKGDLRLMRQADDVDEHGYSLGTPWHRCFCCVPNRVQCAVTFPDAMQDDRAVVNAVLEAAAAAKREGQVSTFKSLAVRGLLPQPRLSAPEPPADGSFAWVVQPSEGTVGGTIYTDGSLIDGPSGPLARLGWAFVVLDAHGNVAASACGTPPSWVRGIAGAEAWALLMAARHAAPGTGFRCDNKGVVDGLRRGSAWALGPERPHARVWALLLTYFDDDSSADAVVWMPSHRNMSQVGKAALGDGSRLTAADLRGNDEADRLAKRAARWYRAPQATRAELAAATAAAARLAAHVGRATWAANHYSDAPKRDSAPRGRRQPGCRGRGGRTAVPRPEVRPPQLGGHTLARKADGRWYCVTCRRSAGSRARIAPWRCAGSAARRWAEAAQANLAVGGATGRGHQRFVSDGLIWCNRCGSYGVAFAVGLARPCPGAPRNVSKAQQLRRLRRGQHPATAVPFARQAVPEPCWNAPLGPPSGVAVDDVARQEWGSAGILSAVERSSHCNRGPTHGVKRARRRPAGLRRCVASADPRARICGGFLGRRRVAPGGRGGSGPAPPCDGRHLHPSEPFAIDAVVEFDFVDAESFAAVDAPPDAGTSARRGEARCDSLGGGDGGVPIINTAKRRRERSPTAVAAREDGSGSVLDAPLCRQPAPPRGALLRPAPHAVAARPSVDPRQRQPRLDLPPAGGLDVVLRAHGDHGLDHQDNRARDGEDRRDGPRRRAQGHDVVPPPVPPLRGDQDADADPLRRAAHGQATGSGMQVRASALEAIGLADSAEAARPPAKRGRAMDEPLAAAGDDAGIVVHATRRDLLRTLIDARPAYPLPLAPPRPRGGGNSRGCTTATGVARAAAGGEAAAHGVGVSHRQRDGAVETRGRLSPPPKRARTGASSGFSTRASVSSAGSGGSSAPLYATRSGLLAALAAGVPLR